jgi:hypothetical protein
VPGGAGGGDVAEQQVADQVGAQVVETAGIAGAAAVPGEPGEARVDRGDVHRSVPQAQAAHRIQAVLGIGGVDPDTPVAHRTVVAFGERLWLGVGDQSGQSPA